MSNLKISRKHQLSHQECTDVAQDLLQQLVGKYGGHYKQKGDCYEYRHSSGMKAMVEPKDGELDIAVKLNLMTRAFAPQIESQVNDVLDKYIES